jgi:tetratricopeptide (TPR) repeat protein
LGVSEVIYTCSAGKSSMQKDNLSVLSLAEKIDTVLRERLQGEGFSLENLVPIPSRGDRSVRARTLEDLLQSFTDDTDPKEEPNCRTYLIQVRAHPLAPTPALPVQNSKTEANSERLPFTSNSQDPIRNADGSWNLPYLQKNAELLSRHGEHTHARSIWLILSKNHEWSSQSHYYLGLGFEAEGAFEKARIHFQESLAFNPKLDTVLALASVHSKLKRDADAARVLERGTSLPQLTPTLKAALHISASNAWYRTGKLELAEAAALSATELTPDDPKILSNLGVIRLKAGRTSEALTLFQKAIHKKPNLAQAHEGLALCYLEQGQKRAAHDQLVRALAAEIGNPRALQLLVRLGYELRIYSVATRILEEYISMQPVTPGLIYSLAGLQFLQGRHQDSLESCARVMGMQPSHVGASELIRRIDRKRMDANSTTASLPSVMEDAQNGHGRQLTPR